MQSKHSSKHRFLSFGYTIGVLSLGAIAAAFLLLSKKK